MTAGFVSDILTMVWKEIRELLFQRGRFRGGWTGLIFFVAVFGIFMPLQSGRAWVESPLSLLYWSWVPFLLVSGVIADSFAGERERHTLETLLASRLSDRAILFGKMAAAIVYGWGLTIVCIFISLVTVNIAHGNGQLIFYPPLIGLGIFSFSFLIAGLATGLGVLVSLRAATVRQAQQTFSIVYFLLFVPLFFLPMLPQELQRQIAQFLLSMDLRSVALTFVAVLLILDLVLIRLAMSRFQRARLILD